jgi:hypothetical protein
MFWAALMKKNAFSICHLPVRYIDQNIGWLKMGASKQLNGQMGCKH